MSDLTRTRADGPPRYWLRQGDAVEWLRGLADRSVELAISDPPYESLYVLRRRDDVRGQADR